MDYNISRNKKQRKKTKENLKTTLQINKKHVKINYTYTRRKIT